jgi:hypothetical protein
VTQSAFKILSRTVQFEVIDMGIRIAVYPWVR